MMKHKRVISLFYLVPLLSVLWLAGCINQTYRAASSGINHTKAKIDHYQATFNKTPPPVVMNAGYYVDTTPLSLRHSPKWLNQRVDVHAIQLPFRLLVARLMTGIPINIAYSMSVKSEQPVDFDYKGTLRDALDQLASLTHYAYTIDHGDIQWSAFETKTFPIAFMPGSSNYLMGQAQGGTGAVNHPVFGGGTTAVSPEGLHDQQYSNLEGRLSVWEDIRRTLNGLKSHDGKVFVSESTSAVTVYDHPDNVAEMANYVDQLNQSLSQEVGIKVQVLEVNLDDDYNSGIDWNAVVRTLNTKFALIGNLASATNPLNSTVIASNMVSPLATFQIQRGETNTLIQALSRQGRVRIVTRPQVVTMNDQIASIRITQNTGYVQSVSSTTFGTENYVTSSITPGSVTDGFTLYVLPRIQGNRVYMQITSTISDLLDIQKETASSGDASSNNQQFSAIEVPTMSEKSFNQRSMVKSGMTLIIAGYNRLKDLTKNAKLFGIDALGGKGAQRQNVETLVLISPTILPNR